MEVKLLPEEIIFSTEAKADEFPHLGFVASAGHPVLKEAKGPADFVLL